MSYVDRVAERAARIRVARVLLSILAAPLYVLGAVAALVVVLAAYAWAGIGLGYADVRERARRGLG